MRACSNAMGLVNGAFNCMVISHLRREKPRCSGSFVASLTYCDEQDRAKTRLISAGFPQTSAKSRRTNGCEAFGRDCHEHIARFRSADVSRPPPAFPRMDSRPQPVLPSKHTFDAARLLPPE